MGKKIKIDQWAVDEALHRAAGLQAALTACEHALARHQAVTGFLAPKRCHYCGASFHDEGPDWCPLHPHMRRALGHAIPCGHERAAVASSNGGTHHCTKCEGRKDYMEDESPAARLIWETPP